MSIENQATFYLRNVCDYSPEIGHAIAVSDFLINGFSQFSRLLRTIYQDWRSYETSTVPSKPTKIGIMTDDLENYHNLTDTVDALYAIAAAGEFRPEGAAGRLCVPKALFKTIYKKSVALPFKMLRKYGFIFEYYKNNKEMSDYKRCDLFQVSYENGDQLPEALRFIATRLAEIGRIKEMPERVAFMLADYDFILTGTINQNPFSESILQTIGEPAAALWKKIVPVLQEQCGLTAETSFNPYVFPNRTVTFRKNKKTVCKFEIRINSLFIRLPLSFDTAKKLILDKESLPAAINQNIDRFGCVGCGRCGGKYTTENVNGVQLCTLSYSNFITEDSRALRFFLTSPEEIDVIAEILLGIYGK